MLNRKMKPIAIAVGTAFAASVATNAAADPADLFEANLLDDGVVLTTSHKEGGCGEDKESGDEGKCGEGKCGGEGQADGESEDGESEDGDTDDESEEEAE